MSERKTKKIVYIQPPVRESIKPKINFKPSDLPFATETITGASFSPIDAKLASQCKADAIRPETNFKFNPDLKMDTDTVTGLSYQHIEDVYREPPFINSSQMPKPQGPIQTMTTQKHDFCFKTTKRVAPVIRDDNLRGSSMPIDDSTVTKLSFQEPGDLTKTPSFKPNREYKQPEQKMDTETCQKLSYLPVQTEPRFFPPWGRKKQFQKPEIPMSCDTMYEHSYPPPGQFIEVDDENADIHSIKSNTLEKDICPKAGV